MVLGSYYTVKGNPRLQFLYQQCVIIMHEAKNLSRDLVYDKGSKILASYFTSTHCNDKRDITL